jgi:hypothetical protein
MVKGWTMTTAAPVVSSGVGVESGGYNLASATVEGDSAHIFGIEASPIHTSGVPFPSPGFGGTFPTLMPITEPGVRSVVVHDWRANVRKLVMLGRLQKGWDHPDSQPLDRRAEANYLDWLPRVPASRMDDAEPMLTDDGHIRLEWRRDGYVRIAEIGPDSLYLAALASNRANDDAEDFDRYDSKALHRFFVEGVIRQ